jgi:hypothetical protein
MSKGLIIGGVVILLVVIGLVIYFTMMKGGEPTPGPAPGPAPVPAGPGTAGPGTAGPVPAGPPSSFSFVGSGGCHNDELQAGNVCRATEECDYIGQQSNGCWHLLKSGGSGKIPSNYPKALIAISPVSKTYDFVTGGPCIGTDQYRSVADTCKTTSGCDTIGQQSNGCWHLLKANSAGAKYISYYPKSIMPSNL